MVKKLSKNHYVAQPGRHTSSQRSLVHSHYLNHHPNSRSYSTDGEDSGRSERTMSEYMNGSLASGKRYGGRARSADRRHRSRERRHDLTDHEGSDIYITSPAYRAPSEYSRGSRYSRHSGIPASHYSYRSAPPSVISGATTVKTRVDKKRGLLIETMSAPNPFCPNTKGICCLMLLLNLGLILVTLGFVIVIQFFEPFFVWILGIVFLIFGFLTLIGSLIYCVTVCRDAKTPSQVAASNHYWTHHWQKNIGAPPEIHYTTTDEKYHTDTDAYSVSEKQQHHHDPRRQQPRF